MNTIATSAIAKTMFIAGPDVFDHDGNWVSGELREADPNLCGWLAGPQLPPSVALLPKDLPTSQQGA